MSELNKGVQATCKVWWRLGKGGEAGGCIFTRTYVVLKTSVRSALDHSVGVIRREYVLRKAQSWLGCLGGDWAYPHDNVWVKQMGACSAA